MGAVPKDTNLTARGESPVEFAPSLASGAEQRVLPVIVQTMIPQTTGAIALQAIASIPRPSEGTIRVIDTSGLAELNFNFPTLSVHIAALDVDLVMVFPDNSKLILPNLALALLGSNPPKINFLGKPVPAQDVVGAINQVTLADAAPSIHLASIDFLPKKPNGPRLGSKKAPPVKTAWAVANHRNRYSPSCLAANSKSLRRKVRPRQAIIIRHQ